MPFYKIYAGLGGSFGGPHYECTEEHDNEDLANNSAYLYACDIYEAQEGIGIDGWADFLIEAESELNEDDFDDIDEYSQALETYADIISSENREHWISYYTRETPNLNDKD